MVFVEAMPYLGRKVTSPMQTKIQKYTCSQGGRRPFRLLFQLGNARQLPSRDDMCPAAAARQGVSPTSQAPTDLGGMYAQVPPTVRFGCGIRFHRIDQQALVGWPMLHLALSTHVVVGWISKMSGTTLDLFRCWQKRCRYSPPKRFARTNIL